MRHNTLQEWLRWQESLHPKSIDLGLARVRQVHEALGHAATPPFVTITVAGTNGKGSTVAFLEAIYLAAGYRVGTYTSPHLLRYNERIRLDGEPVPDEMIMQAFDRIDRARGETSLSYFEFGTLAALDIFFRNPPDVVILEVGLGGRLDAVNIVDPELALITNIGRDHTDWLGDDIETIAAEKAGILRPGIPAVFVQRSLPEALAERARSLQVRLLQLGRDFDVESGDEGLIWHAAQDRLRLPHPGLAGGFQHLNAAGAIAAVQALQQRLSIPLAALRQGLAKAGIVGRFQTIEGPVSLILDVAHNPDGAEALANSLSRQPCNGRTLAVLAMLGDKDIPAVVDKLRPQVDGWFLAGLDVPRGLDGEGLLARLGPLSLALAGVSATVKEALQSACDVAEPGDRILVFGSFFTVSEALLTLK